MAFKCIGNKISRNLYFKTTILNSCLTLSPNNFPFVIKNIPAFAVFGIDLKMHSIVFIEEFFQTFIFISDLFTDF